MNEVLRQEKKFLINLEEFVKGSAYLAHFLMQDPHNGEEGYKVRSLYFDSLEDRDLIEKLEGVEVRRKIRLRCYGPESEYALLEMKQKQGEQQLKRSLRMSRKDAQELIAGNYSVLLSYKEPFAVECYGVMQMHLYRPKCIVEYNRKAFIAKENKIRITFDHNIVATESDYNLFSDTLNMHPVWDRFNVVLEVKYNGFLLSYIRDLINGLDHSELSVSKYCLARSTTYQI